MSIVWTKGGRHGQSMKLEATVIATVREIGRGQITVAHVLWAINTQLTGADAMWQLTSAQVRRVLNSLVGYWPSFRSNGHGVYRWL